jgi:hypothetical protein
MARNTRIRLVLVVVVVVFLGVLFGARQLWNLARTHFPSTGCTVGGYDLDTDQAAVASTMVGAVSRYRPALPERAAVLALAAALQESKLRNLAPGDGDRDSVGVLQQRPSQGWGGGSAAKLNDVTEATTEFLDKLVEVDGWQSLPLAEAIQDVQISADGSAYTQHADEAKTLADAFLGRRPAAVSCSFETPTKVASAATVARQLRRQLPVSAPTAHDGAVRVPGAGWQTVAWLVANADRLGIDTVAHAGRKWTRADGWSSAAAPATAVTATLHKL